MEGRIKTALEKALERANSFPEVSPEEIARVENIPRGRSMGASYMNNKDFNLKEALALVPEGIRQHVAEGLQEVLLMSITLPADENAEESNRRAIAGIVAIKKDRSGASGLIGELDQLLQYYLQAMDQTRERFKQDFEMRSRAARRQGVRERTMERMEFREEWANVVRQLNQKFEMGLADLKDRIRKIS